MGEWSNNRLRQAIFMKLSLSHISKANAITGKDLTAYVNRAGFPEIDQRTLRLVIRDMRLDGEPICSAAGAGYFWPSSLEEVEECRAVEFDSKAKDMLHTGKAMFEGAVRHFGHQRSLGL